MLSYKADESLYPLTWMVEREGGMSRFDYCTDVVQEEEPWARSNHAKTVN